MSSQKAETRDQIDMHKENRVEIIEKKQIKNLESLITHSFVKTHLDCKE
jgi:hypothetical protein